MNCPDLRKEVCVEQSHCTFNENGCNYKQLAELRDAFREKSTVGSFDVACRTTDDLQRRDALQLPYAGCELLKGFGSVKGKNLNERLESAAELVRSDDGAPQWERVVARLSAMQNPVCIDNRVDHTTDEQIEPYLCFDQENANDPKAIPRKQFTTANKLNFIDVWSGLLQRERQLRADNTFNQTSESSVDAFKSKINQEMLLVSATEKVLRAYAAGVERQSVKTDGLAPGIVSVVHSDFLPRGTKKTINVAQLKHCIKRTAT